MSTVCTNSMPDSISIEALKTKLEGELSPKRFIHSLSVMRTARELAKKYLPGCIHSAAVAGLLHDCARDISNQDILGLCKEYGIPCDEIQIMQPQLLHAPLGGKLARVKYNINNDEIINAINFHTVGKENMSMLEKIVFVADYIEPNRNYPDIAGVRELANRDIDRAVLTILERTIKYILTKGSLVHVDAVMARNYLVKKLNFNEGAV